MADNLIYLSYGAGPHVLEAVFSILSAHYFLKNSPSTRIVVYTDNAAPFADLNASIELISPQEFQEWLGPHGPIHRRKILAHHRALEKYGNSALIDSDTYFTHSPEILLSRIGPRQSVLHICEGPLKHLREHEFTAHAMCRAPYQVRDKSYAFTMDWQMWNSGVTGLHASNAFLMDEALQLCDALRQRDGINVSSQTSCGRVIGEYTHIVRCDDVIFHYWRGYLRKPFQQQLAQFMPQISSLSLEQRAAEAYLHRPRPTWPRTIRSTAKHMAHKLGITRVGLLSDG
jgi:hypothetical protein